MSERADEMNEEISGLIQRVLKIHGADSITAASIFIDICRELNDAGWIIERVSLLETLSEHHL